MKLRPVFHALAALVSVSVLAAAEQMLVTVTHDLTIARASETIVVPWSQVNAALPGAMLQRIAVKDAAGHVLPYQVTNVAPQAKDPRGVGIAYGELIFQYDFAAGEKSATFTVEKIDSVAPVFPIKTFGRYVPERLDDFGWENDKIGHRTYGPALAAPAAPGVTKEVLVTSGLDVWCKRVNYLIVDRWYNKGHDHYHKDEGEGMDMYQVGPSRGCGGTGIWDGKTLFVGRNYKSWRVITNGPVRTVFELTYDAWDAAGTQVSEVKRFTVDAGHNLDQIESTFTVVAGDPKEITVAIGLNKTPADKNQDANVALTSSAATGTLTQWVTQKTNGELGTALIMPKGSFVGFTADSLNELILAKATTGQPLRYYAGAGWSKAGEFKSQADWNAYVSACAMRAASPIKITVASK
jgi:pectinesterase